MGNGTDVWRSLLARLAAARYARAAGVALLAAAAIGQLAAQAAPPAALDAERVLAVGVLALVATVPLAVYRPAMAALAVTFGNAVALASFGQVTAGGVVAELIAACWLGLAGGLEGVRTFRGLGGPG